MRRLLLVEDDNLVRRACARILAKTHQVDEATTLARAYELLDLHVYERAIFDVRLPDGNGFALLKSVRLSGKHFPVLMVTGELDPTFAQLAIRLRARLAYKPARAEVLREFLDEGAQPPSLDDVVLEYCQQDHDLSSRRTKLILALAHGTVRADLDVELGVAESTVKTMVTAILRETGLPTMDAVLGEILKRYAESQAGTHMSGTRLRAVPSDEELDAADPSKRRQG